jgi:DNA-directed RNA polymerase specialized sigma24 family protein
LTQKNLSQHSPGASPLSGRNSANDLYQRDVAVEKQIQSAIILTDERIIANARIREKEAEAYLQEEAIVYLIKMSKQEDNENLYNALSNILLERIEHQVKFYLRSFDIGLKEDAYNEFLARLFQHILRTDGKGDFLQVKFWLALNRLAISVFRRFQSREKRERKLLDPGEFSAREENDKGEEDADEDFIEPERLIPGENRWSSVEQWSLILEAMQNLDENVRRAYFLNHFLGWQIESIDPNESSVSDHFGKTPKTIRNWLHKADAALEKKWRGDHHE